jgi:hypothetical protein
MQRTTRFPLAAAAALFAAVVPLSACNNGEAVSGASWAGPPFSAEMFDPAHPSKPGSRIYIGDGRIRLESEDTSSMGAIVVDPAHGTAILVNDPAKSYIDAGMFTSLITIGFAPLMRVLRPTGSGDPCTQWNNAINPFGAFAKSKDGTPPPKFTCHSLGAESVGGRPAQKWAVTSNDPKDKESTIWVDDKLQVLSRSQDENGAMEMRNVHEGAPPDSLFTPPAGYKKISMSSIIGGMMGGSKNGDQSGASASFLKKLQGASSH